MKKQIIIFSSLLIINTVSAQSKWSFYIGGATSKLYNKTPEYYNAWHNLASTKNEQTVFYGKLINTEAAVNNYLIGSSYRIFSRNKFKLLVDLGFTSMRYSEHIDGGKSENYPYCFYCPNPAGDTLSITQKNVYRYFFAGPVAEYFFKKNIYIKVSLLANYVKNSKKFKFNYTQSTGYVLGRNGIFTPFGYYIENYADYKKIMLDAKIGIGLVMGRRFKFEAEYYHSVTPINSFSTLSRLYFGGLSASLHYCLKEKD